MGHMSNLLAISSRKDSRKKLFVAARLVCSGGQTGGHVFRKMLQRLGGFRLHIGKTVCR